MVIQVYSPLINTVLAGNDYSAAPITIGQNKYNMGVILMKDANVQRLYIHDAIIEKEVSNFFTGYPNTIGTGKKKKDLFLSNSLDEILFVKNKEQYNETYLDAVKRIKQSSMTQQQRGPVRIAKMVAELLAPTSMYVLA